MTFTDFFALGGYGMYVWPAYGTVTIVLGWQWINTWHSWKKAHEQHS